MSSDVKPDDPGGGGEVATDGSTNNTTYASVTDSERLGQETMTAAKAVGGVINLVQQNIIMFMFCCWFVAESNIRVKFPLLEIILPHLSFKNQ